MELSQEMGYGFERTSHYGFNISCAAQDIGLQYTIPMVLFEVLVLLCCYPIVYGLQVLLVRHTPMALNHMAQ